MDSELNTVSSSPVIPAIYRGLLMPTPTILSHPNFFFLLMIIIYSSTKELILKYSISALKNLNVEFLLDFVLKEDMQNLL